MHTRLGDGGSPDRVFFLVKDILDGWEKFQVGLYATTVTSGGGARRMLLTFVALWCVI